MKSKYWLSPSTIRYIRSLVRGQEYGTLSRLDEELFWNAIDRDIGVDNVDADGKLVVPGVEFFIDNGHTHFQETLPIRQPFHKSRYRPQQKRKLAKRLGLRSY